MVKRDITTLKNNINTDIISNGIGAITGPILNTILIDMADSLPGAAQGKHKVRDVGAFDEGDVTGNARGENSVDFQTDRANADEVAASNWGAILGGEDNKIDSGSTHSSICGGSTNKILNSSTRSILTGGQNCRVGVNAAATNAFIGGGEDNDIHRGDLNCIVGGGFHQICNVSTGYRNVIGGGGFNTISQGNYNTVGGGGSNGTSGVANYNTISGGYFNTASTGNYNTVSGGFVNKINTSSSSVIAGGRGNTITNGALHSILGGWFNNLNSTGKSNALVGGFKNYLKHANVTATTISFTANNQINRSSGDFINDGFRAGMTIYVSGTASNNGTYTISSVTATQILTVETSVTTEAAGGSFTIHTQDTITRTDISFATSPDTITTVGGNFVTAGFIPDTWIEVAGSTSNDGFYFVTAVTTTVLTLHASRGTEIPLSTESAGDSVTITTLPFFSLLGGGENNVLMGSDSFLGSGYSNFVDGGLNVVGGGQNNAITRGSNNFVGSGASNKIDGSYHSGIISGNLCNVNGDYSIASGRRAKANANGAFVFADSTNADFTITTANQFAIRASGGLRLVDGNESNGRVLKCDANGVGTWQDASGGSGGTVQGTDATYDIQAANEGTVTGNARGENSVDLQTDRTWAEDVASGAHSVICGGDTNRAQAHRSAIVGGRQNRIESTSEGAFIGGGYVNTIGLTYDSDTSVICGGNWNSIRAGVDEFLGGGDTNMLWGTNHGVIVGGHGNRLGDSYGDWTDACFIGGGYENYVYDSYQCVLVGGASNHIYGNGSLALWSVIVGGKSNTLMNVSDGCAILGGKSNTIGKSGTETGFSSITGGQTNRIGVDAAGSHNFIGGGQNNDIHRGSKSSILGGDSHAIGSTAVADNSVILGGNAVIVNHDFVSAFGKSIDSNRDYEEIFSNGHLGAGVGHSCHCLLTQTTTGATPASLLQDGTNKLLLPNDNSLLYGKIFLAGRRTDAAGNVNVYEIDFAIKRDTAASSTTLVYSNVAEKYEDQTGITVSASADTTNGALDISVTAVASQNWTWAGRCHFTEIDV